jgi:hypothetical protein
MANYNLGGYVSSGQNIPSQPGSSSHVKKLSAQNQNGGGIPSGTQTLKQSLKDLQEMLKITQNKLHKQNSA